MRINKFKEHITIRKYALEKEYLNKVNENIILNEELGFKDVAMGLAIMAGMFGGSISKATAQTKLSDKQLIQSIEQTLNDKDKLNSVVAELDKIGFSDASASIEANANKFKEEIKKLKGNRQGVVKQGDFHDLAKKLKSGWAISDIIIKKAQTKVLKDVTLYDTIVNYSTVEINFDTDELFSVGNYELGSDFKANLENIMKQIKDSGNTIMSFEIESSTDKQRIKADGETAKNLSQDGYEISNDGLSKARNNAVKNVILNICGENVPKIDQIIKSNQGEGIDNATTPQDASARYVKIKIHTTNINENTVVEKTETIETIEDTLIYSIKIAKAGEQVIIEQPKGGVKGGDVKVFKQSSKLGKCPTFKK